MKTSLLSLFAGTVLLTGSAIAGAGEPTTLSSAQLDTVTAGAYDYQSIYQKVSVKQRAEAYAIGDYSYNTATAYNTSAVTLSASQAITN